MRKITIISTAIIMLFISVNLYSQNTKSGFHIGPGLGFATEIDQIGISLKGVYNITNEWEIAPMYTYYLEKDGVNWGDLFINGNYVFYQQNNVGIYASAGLTVTFVSVEVLGEKYSENETNLNLGGGMYFKISNSMKLGADLKYTIGDADHLFIGAQLLFAI